MAIYNPSVLYPLSGEAFDATLSSIFTWEFESDAGEVQTSYRLIIYSLANATVYDSGVISNANQSHTVPASTLVNNTVYKWKITTTSGATSRTNNSAAIFNCFNTPVVVIDALPFPFNRQFYNFTATYTQAQSIPASQFRWTLYNASDVIMAQTDWIIGDVIEHEFNNFENATTYKVKCEVYSQFNLLGTSSTVSFTTVYTLPFSPDTLTITDNINSGSNKADWSGVVTQTGSVNGTTFYVPGKWDFGLDLNGNCLTYDLDLDVPLTFSGAGWIKFDSGYSGTFFKMYKNGEIQYSLRWDKNLLKFVFEYGKRKTASQPFTLPTTFMLFTFKPSYVTYEIGGVTYILR